MCKDVELRYTTSNVSVVQNTIAVKNDYKNTKGEYDSQFINFVAYRNNAEFLSKYVSKGGKVLLEGRMNNRTYDKKDGTKAYITEVIVDKVELLGFKPKEEADTKTVEEPDPYFEFGQEIDIDDDILD